jgi:hypothetical protein
MAHLPLDSGLLTKASVLRGYIDQLHTIGLFEPVCARVPPDTRELLQHPPHMTEWYSGHHSRAIFEALGAETDARTVRRMTRNSLNTSFFLIMRPVIQGLLRLFGASPRSLFAHAEQALRGSVRGIRYVYRDCDAKAGIMEYYTVVPWTEMAAEAWAGTAEAVLDVCGVEGSVVLDGVRTEGLESVLCLRITWS